MRCCRQIPQSLKRMIKVEVFQCFVGWQMGLCEVAFVAAPDAPGYLHFGERGQEARKRTACQPSRSDRSAISGQNLLIAGNKRAHGRVQADRP
jgi:hypothetical protein